MLADCPVDRVREIARMYPFTPSIEMYCHVIELIKCIIHLYFQSHLQPIKPLLLRNFFNFFTFILGRPILITPEGQLSEMGILQTSKQNETGGFQCLGHSN